MKKGLTEKTQDSGKLKSAYFVIFHHQEIVKINNNMTGTKLQMASKAFLVEQEE